MNVYDADRMFGVLKKEGYDLSQDAKDSEIIILNTCHIREKAAEKVYSDLGRLAKQKNQRNKVGLRTIIAVGGCVAQAEGREIILRAPYVDIVFGPQTYHRLPDMISRSKSGESKIIEIEFPLESKFDSLPNYSVENSKTAFVTVQEGCDKFCTFCVVPYTRGMEYSRPLEQVELEVKKLVSSGVREVTLLGQNVNNYHGKSQAGKELSLGALIKRLSKIGGLTRIRYFTSYPADVDDELIDAHREVRALMPFLHLPLQSGSNKILKAMNRRHSADDYRNVVGRLRVARPEIALSSDFIVGFPGESEADFEDTINIVKEIGFVQAYSFKYSKRPGTPAADLKEQVPEKVKDMRLARLQDVLSLQQFQFNCSFVGKSMPVLLDRRGRYDGQLVGRSPFMQAVHVMAPVDLLGEMVDLTISSAQRNSLSGEIAKSI